MGRLPGVPGGAGTSPAIQARCGIAGGGLRPYHQINLAEAYRKWAAALLDEGDPLRANQRLGQAITLSDELLAERPWLVLARRLRATCDTLRGRIHEENDSLAPAAASYQAGLDGGDADAADRLADLYDSGRGVGRDPDRAKELRARRPSLAMKRFTIPCQVAGYDAPYPLFVYITAVADPAQDDPLADEQKRLREEFDATIPSEVVDSFKRLLKIARENNVSFVDLCVYALGGEAEKDAAKKAAEKPDAP